MNFYHQIKVHFLFLDVIKYTPVNSTNEAIIDWVDNFSFKNIQPKNNAITGFTYAEVDTFSGDTFLVKS